MTVPWQALLLIFRCIDVRLETLSFRHSLTEDEVAAARHDFLGFPGLASRLSCSEACIEVSVAAAREPLRTLTPLGDGGYWPSPPDTKNAGAGRRRFDSVFVHWPRTDPSTGREVRSGGWGLAVGPGEWTDAATYATVCNVASEVWRRPVRGEVWLHEWLHGVCAFYAGRGWEMPPGDADGAERLGYLRTADGGWTDYYADLMTGRVEVGKRLTGVPAAAWRSGPPVSAPRPPSSRSAPGSRTRA